MPAPAPIVILGILPRSGTNYLTDLLMLHPACAPASVNEDFLAHEADLLLRYTAAVAAHWARLPAWPPDRVAATARRLAAALGDALRTFLNDGVPAGRRVVTKTPSVRNVEVVLRLWPDAHLLILVRDGRAVVESGVASFNWRYEPMTHAWAWASRTLARFEAAAGAAERARYRVVRYEDLMRETAGEMRAILDFLELDSTRYDFAAAATLPVRGSSESRSGSADRIDWRPAPRTSEFGALTRWRHWDRRRHERFNWCAGRELERRGYAPERATGGRLRWALWNLALDVRWYAGAALRRLRAAVESSRR